MRINRDDAQAFNCDNSNPVKNVSRSSTRYSTLTLNYGHKDPEKDYLVFSAGYVERRSYSSSYSRAQSPPNR